MPRYVAALDAVEPTLPDAVAAAPKNDAQSEALPVSAANSFKEKFEQGVISSLELTTVDNNYLSAESAYLSAKLDVLRAKNDLETLTGEVYNKTNNK